jgi:hypothetical protein
MAEKDASYASPWLRVVWPPVGREALGAWCASVVPSGEQSDNGTTATEREK